MVEREPAIVVRPVSELDVVNALCIAVQHEMPISVRGAGHSQSGQSLGTGVVLDMTRLNRVVSVDAAAGLVEVESGACWHDVVAATFVRGKLPTALTQALDPTVGGTLSIGGIGAESFRAGAQVDNVRHFDVATLHGKVVRCSLDQNRDLFDATRSGLGQCGVIVSVGYPLRPCRPSIRTRAFAYRDAARFANDATTLADAQGDGRWLTGSVVRDPLGHGRCLFMLLVGEEVDPVASMPLPKLECDVELPPREASTWSPDGNPGHGFFHLFDPPGQRTTQTTSVLNPWLEYLFPLDMGVAVLQALGTDFVDALTHARAGLILVRRKVDQCPAPLFVPHAEVSAGIGLFFTFRDRTPATAATIVSRYDRALRLLGGKRYLSGYLANDAGHDWSEHYGASWADFVRAKRQYDPNDLLSPGFIRWT